MLLQDHTAIEGIEIAFHFLLSPCVVADTRLWASVRRQTGLDMANGGSTLQPSSVSESRLIDSLLLDSQVIKLGRRFCDISYPSTNK